MPGVEASQLTRLHRAETLATASLVTDRVRSLGRSAQTGDIDGWWRQLVDELLALIGAGWEAVRQLAAGYLIDHAGTEGRTVEPILAAWSSDRVATSLRVTGPVAFKRHMAVSGDPAVSRAVMSRTLAGSSERLVLAGERDTVMATVRDADAIVGWRRVVDADPCAFCAMLASRGAVYDLNTVHFDAHDGDECVAEPLYEHEDEPAEVDDLYQQWLAATAGRSGAAALREWRRYWDERKAGS